MVCRAAGAQVDAGRRGRAVPRRREGIAARKVLRTPAAGARGALNAFATAQCRLLCVGVLTLLLTDDLPCAVRNLLVAPGEGKPFLAFTLLTFSLLVLLTTSTTAQPSHKPDTTALGLLSLRRTTTAGVAVWRVARPAAAAGARSPRAATATAPRTPQPRHFGNPRPSKRLHTTALAGLRFHTDVFGC